MTIDFSEWLLAEIQQRNWTQAELARRANTTSATVYRVINRERKPGVDFCKGVAQAFGMRDVEVMKLAGIANNLSADDQPPSIRELISKFMALSDEDQESVLNHVRALNEMKQAEKRRGLKLKGKPKPG